MEREESEFEVIVSSIAVGSSLECSNLVVGAFQRAGGDRVIVPVQESCAMSTQGVAHGPEHSNAGGFRASALVVEERRGCGLRGLLPELTQVVFEVVRLSQWFVELERLGQT